MPTAQPHPHHHQTSTPLHSMPTFTSKSFRSSSASAERTIGALYRRHLAKHPFLLFGLPFIGTIVAGSFFLTPATALRYEKHDRKVQRISQDEAMGLSKDRRKVDLNEEYYRLATKDIDNWEQKRVERLKGEHDGKL
ncbi:cytochrome c oxidase assembly protein COX16-domain-containing protein [Tricharina praecox]|uniref:cytochrome c oxidase assembly protein COX16-domain-containing protein n=1 Tax=Tricharina praecox TaxID=43433 RepID=UPI0022202691|nr:cytochrome c oxidase assembly protein COX16-domain-containing protein [Tricharina praecox]KAI5848138.1 cytochrome c oxidase assembly protein COX16-domain-containing protein [Tricharina praecox]